MSNALYFLSGACFMSSLLGGARNNLPVFRLIQVVAMLLTLIIMILLWWQRRRQRMIVNQICRMYENQPWDDTPGGINYVERP